MNQPVNEGKFEIWNQDILEWCRAYDGDPFHLVFCDPPYDLTSQRTGIGAVKGFMGKAWDGTGIAFRAETWEALAEHLLPGGFMVVFGGSRTFHRMIVAMEDAGLILRENLMCYNYGQGFPKNHDIGKNIDKQQGSTTMSDEAAQWQGYGNALKPSFEPIVIAQKPFDGTIAANALRNGTGGYNIDGARIGWPSGIPPEIGTPQWGGPRKKLSAVPDQCGQTLERTPPNAQGRWPANTVICHHPNCHYVGTSQVKGSRVEKPCQSPTIRNMDFGSIQVNRPASGIGDENNRKTVGEYECDDYCPVRQFGEGSGHLKSGTSDGFVGERTGQIFNGLAKNELRSDSRYGDEGTAARFFFNADWSFEVAEQLDGANDAIYCAKPSPAERNAGVSGERGNFHPCLKPLSLLQHLSTLVLPSASVAPRRVCVPFAGSMSEGIGAFLAGWDEIVAIESDTEEGYIPIAVERARWWQEQVARCGLSDSRELLRLYQSKSKVKPTIRELPTSSAVESQSAQLGLF